MITQTIVTVAQISGQAVPSSFLTDTVSIGSVPPDPGRKKRRAPASGRG